MLTATLGFNAITRDYAQSLARTAKSTIVARETEYYRNNIEKVKTLDGLLKNDRLYTYVMTAFGLGDMLQAKGLVRKVLEGGLTNPASVANRLYDARYRALAAAFDFASLGPQTTSTVAARQGTIDRYAEIALESDAAKQNEGVRMALYFRRMAPKITSETAILADKTLLKVVQTAFGLASAMSLQSIDRQATLIARHLDIADLQDPAKLRKLIERFTANYDAKNSVAAVQTTGFAATSVGISPTLLVSLANLKRGGF